MLWPIGMRIAGSAVILVACIHGIAAEAKLFPHVTAATPAHVLLLRFVWQASALAWASFGLLLIASPRMGRDPTRWIAAAAMGNLALGAAGGLMATGPMHHGWVLLAALVVLIGIVTPWRA